MKDTATKEGMDARRAEMVEHYKETHNRYAIQRLVGGTLYDHEDYIPGLDDGEEPITKGADRYVCPDPIIDAMTEGELYEANELAGIGH